MIDREKGMLGAASRDHARLVDPKPIICGHTFQEFCLSVFLKIYLTEITFDMYIVKETKFNHWVKSLVKG